MATLTIVFQQYSKELHKTWVFNALVLCFAFLSSLFWLIKLRRSASKRNFPPSPPKLPLIGNLHQLGLLSPRSFLALSDKYGPLLLLHLGQSPTLLASSAEMAQEILKTQDADFTNRHIPWPAGQLFYGGENIGFSSYGERWKELRKPCVTALLSWKSVQSSNYIRKEEIADLVMKLRELSFQKEPANLGKMLINIATNIIFRCVLGRKYEEDVGPEFAQVTMEVSDLSLAFSFRDFFPSIGWMDKFTGLDRKVGGTFRKFDQFLDRAIKEQEEMKDESEPSEKKNLIQILLDLWNGGTAGSYLTKKSLKAVIMDILIAANDSSSSTIEWAMAELVKSPTSLKKAQDEVRRVVGKKDRIDSNDLDQLDFLKCVIKETLRLHPPAPFLIPRETSTWMKLKGYDIPPKTAVFVNAFAIQRDPKVWDMPEEFRPERFHNTPVDFRGQHFEFIPFGAGRRSCPGVPFANASMELILSNLLYWFDWDLPSGVTSENLDMTEAYGFAIHRKNPLHLVPTCFYP